MSIKNDPFINAAKVAGERLEEWGYSLEPDELEVIANIFRVELRNTSGDELLEAIDP